MNTLLTLVSTYGASFDETPYTKSHIQEVGDTVTLVYTRHGNDIYGNPLYKVRGEFSDTTDALYNSSFLFRRYRSKGYALVQSYNIDEDIKAIIREMTTVTIGDHIAVPAFRIDLTGWQGRTAKDAVSYEFSLVRPSGEYYTEEADDQEYDTFRVYEDGAVLGTLSDDYFVYDQLELPGIDTKQLFKQFEALHKRFGLISDHTKQAIECFENEED